MDPVPHRRASRMLICFQIFNLLFGLIKKISNLMIEEVDVLGFEPGIENLPIIRLKSKNNLVH